MKNAKIFMIGFILTAVFLLFACGDGISGTGEYRSFERNLRGTWQSEQGSKYEGKIYIDYDTIKITGYYENDTNFWDDDNNRPFKDFTKNTNLSGYSQEGRIFMNDRGSWKDGIPYNYYQTGTYYKDEFLEFTFGTRTERLMKVSS